MNTLTIEEELYAIHHIELAIKNPKKFGVKAEDVEKLKAALERHQKHLTELEAEEILQREG